MQFVTWSEKMVAEDKDLICKWTFLYKYVCYMCKLESLRGTFSQKVVKIIFTEYVVTEIPGMPLLG